jgi:small subunit ribosomal protein S3
MAQKINPVSLRTGVIKDWESKWLPKHFKFGRMLQEDFMIRTIIKGKIGQAGIDSISIEKTANAYRITIRVAKPGFVIGKGGKGIEELTKNIESSLTQLRKERKIKEKVVLSLNVEEIKRYDVSAAVTAQNIAWDLEKRMSFRRTIKRYLERVMQNRDAKGIKIRVSGRLDGAEIARTEKLASGTLPLQTLRANIDYAEATAFTTYGTIGIKVWINKGETFSKELIR